MKVAMMFSRPDLDAPLAEHFGKAKWLMIVEPPAACELVRNTELDGRSLASELARRGCTDVIVHHMGPGAHAHVSGAGIRVWKADAEASGRAQLLRLAAGELRSFQPDVGPGTHVRIGPHRRTRRGPPLDGHGVQEAAMETSSRRR